MKMRIGHGYDVHRFAETAPDAPATSIRLGGIDIPHARRLLAHSDGDVLIHALCDALLGALGAGDIGRHFPDSDPAYKGIASTRLLEQVWGLAKQGGWQLGNADVTVVAQAPRLATHVAAMRHKLAGLLEGRVVRVD